MVENMLKADAKEGIDAFIDKEKQSGKTNNTKEKNLEFLIDNKKVFSMDTGEVFDKEKHSIILLHGSGQSHVVWSLTTQFLSDQKNVFAIDFPGHGNSEGESLKTIEEMAEWLNKVINKLGANKVTLVAHSQGCLVALEYFSKFPNNVRNIVFVAGSYEIPVNKNLIELALAGDMESLNLMMKWGYGSSKQFIGGNPLQKFELIKRSERCFSYRFNCM